MGFFDRFKKKAQQAVNQAQSMAGMGQQPQQGMPQQQMPQQGMPPQGMHQQQMPPQGMPQHAAAPAGPSFQWDGDTYALPPGWDGLSIDEWFYKHECLRDNLMNADEEPGLPHMTDEDGDPLDPEEVLLISKYGFQNGGQYEAWRNWSVYNWAQQVGMNFTDCEFKYGSVARERLMAEKAGAMGGAGGALEPVEGVSCEQWAHIQAQLAGGGDLASLIAQAGMDQAKWDRVSAEWMARMQSDTSMAISTVYGNAFAGASQGQFGGQAAHAAAVGTGGDLGPEPIPFEQYVEIMEAQNAAAQRGQDANAVLASFGMSAMDWGNVGMYWSKKMNQEATKYHQLFTEYSAKYAAKYGG